MYGDKVSHRLNSARSREPQDIVVTRNETEHLHINYYTWVSNANTRVIQSMGDKHRRDSGGFVAKFNNSLATENCIKEKLRAMGWPSGDMHVINQTNWVAFAFELLSFAVATAAIVVAPLLIAPEAGALAVVDVGIVEAGTGADTAAAGAAELAAYIPTVTWNAKGVATFLDTSDMPVNGLTAFTARTHALRLHDKVIGLWAGTN